MLPREFYINGTSSMWSPLYPAQRNRACDEEGRCCTDAAHYTTAIPAASPTSLMTFPSEGGEYESSSFFSAHCAAATGRTPTAAQPCCSTGAQDITSRRSEELWWTSTVEENSPPVTLHEEEEEEVALEGEHPSSTLQNSNQHNKFWWCARHVGEAMAAAARHQTLRLLDATYDAASSVYHHVWDAARRASLVDSSPVSRFTQMLSLSASPSSSPLCIEWHSDSNKEGREGSGTRGGEEASTKRPRQEGGEEDDSRGGLLDDMPQQRKHRPDVAVSGPFHGPHDDDQSRHVSVPCKVRVVETSTPRRTMVLPSSVVHHGRRDVDFSTPVMESSDQHKRLRSW